MRRNGEGPWPWYPNMPVEKGGWHLPVFPTTGPRATLTLTGAQLYGQYCWPRDLLPTTLVPADGCVQFSLQVTQVLSPETWCGRPVRRAREVLESRNILHRSGTLTRRCRGIEVGCKAVDVAANGEALIGDPKSSQYGHQVTGYWGPFWQGHR